MQSKFSAVLLLLIVRFSTDMVYKLMTTKCGHHHLQIRTLCALPVGLAVLPIFNTVMTKGETSERRRNCHAPAHSLSRKPLPPQHQHLSLAINSLINLDLKELFFLTGWQRRNVT